MQLQIMGNNKNKRVRAANGCRHSYVKKKLPWMNKKKDKKNNISENSPKQAEPIGSRIINLENLQKFIVKLTEHSSKCDGTINFKDETRNGLASSLFGSCSKCNDESICLKTSKKVRGPHGSLR